MSEWVDIRVDIRLKSWDVVVIYLFLGRVYVLIKSNILLNAKSVYRPLSSVMTENSEILIY